MQPSDLVMKGWCQGYYSHNERHKRVTPQDSGAVAWCALGAIYACYEGSAATAVVFKVLNELPYRDNGHNSRYDTITAWNDSVGRSKWDVIAVLKRAGV